MNTTNKQGEAEDVSATLRCPFTKIDECRFNGINTEIKICEVCRINAIRYELVKLNTTFKPVLEVRTGESKTHAQELKLDKMKPLFDE
jgi:hypothetical protein